MKILFSVLLIFILFTACDDVNDNIIDPSAQRTTLIDITAPSVLTRLTDDVELRVVAQFDNAASIESVWFTLTSQDGSIIITNNQPMTDDGNSQNGDNTPNDLRYTGLVQLTNEYPSDTYSIEIYTELNDGIIQKSGFRSLVYDSGQENVAPVISELSAPDSIVVEDPKSVFRMTVKVDDENGPLDIQNVFFISTRPDGTSNNVRIQMFDSGSFEQHGDETAADGIYSVIVEVTPANTKGEYTFKFHAEDRRGALSNIIEHKIVLL